LALIVPPSITATSPKAPMPPKRCPSAKYANQRTALHHRSFPESPVAPAKGAEALFDPSLLLVNWAGASTLTHSHAHM